MAKSTFDPAINPWPRKITFMLSSESAQRPSIANGDDVANADAVYEIDTAKLYLYNADGAAWVEQ